MRTGKQRVRFDFMESKGYGSFSSVVPCQAVLRICGLIWRGRPRLLKLHETK